MPQPVPISTRVNTGSSDQDGYSFAVQIGGQSFRAPALTGSCAVGIWELTVTRTPAADTSTGRPNWDPQSTMWPMCTANDAKALGAALGTLGDDRLVIINNVVRADDHLLVKLSQLAAALAPIGVTNETGAIELDARALSAVGIHGLPYGQAWQRSEALSDFVPATSPRPPASSIDASLVRDINGRYVLTSFGYVVYDDDATSGGQPGIAVGGQFYPQPGPVPATGGFQVLVVNRQTLAEISNTSYAGCFGCSGGLNAMTATLDQVAGDEGLLVFIRSFGPDPAPVGSDPASDLLPPVVADFSAAIRAVGGTPQALFGLDGTANPVFELVGAASPPAFTLLPPYVAPQAASTIPGGGGDLRGVLAPGHRGMWYGPVSDTTLAGINLDIYRQLATVTQPPTPWPVPVPGNTEQAAAFTTISDSLCQVFKNGCGGNVRSTYTPDQLTTTFDKYDTRLVDITGAGKDDKCNGTDLDAYLTVACQLRTEVEDQETSHELAADLSEILTKKYALSSGRLQQIYNTVDTIVQINGSTKVGSILREVISGILEITGAVVPGAHAAAALTSGVLTAATSLADLTNGEPTGDLATTANQLTAQAADGFAQLDKALYDIFGYIDTDWGRLNAVASAYTTFDEPGLLTQTDHQIQVATYQSLLAALYQVATVGHSTTPCNQGDRHQGHDCYFLDQYSNSSVLSFRTATDKPGTPQWQITVIGPGPYNVRPLSGTEGIPAALMQALANPSLGIYPPDIFLGWPFQQYNCAFSPNVQGYTCIPG